MVGQNLGYVSSPSSIDSLALCGIPTPELCSSATSTSSSSVDHGLIASPQSKDYYTSPQESHPYDSIVPVFPDLTNVRPAKFPALYRVHARAPEVSSINPQMISRPRKLSRPRPRILHLGQYTGSGNVYEPTSVLFQKEYPSCRSPDPLHSGLFLQYSKIFSAFFRRISSSVPVQKVVHRRSSSLPSIPSATSCQHSDTTGKLSSEFPALNLTSSMKDLGNGWKVPSGIRRAFSDGGRGSYMHNPKSKNWANFKAPAILTPSIEENQNSWTPYLPDILDKSSPWADATLISRTPLSVSLFSGLSNTSFLSPNSAGLRDGWRSTWSLGEEEDDDGETGVGGDMRQRSLPIAQMSSHHKHRPRKRWTLAMAVTDERITDDMFVDALEKMRSKRSYAPCGEADSPLASPPNTPTSDRRNLEGIDEAHKGISAKTAPRKLSPSLPSPSDPNSTPTWQAARRALLTCREIVRTERHYLSALRTLSSGETSSTLPPLMITYLPALVHVSESLLLGMERDPSARGIAEAFTEGEVNLEIAFVAWCGVVGTFFVDGEEPSLRPLMRRNTSIKRAVASWRKNLSPDITQSEFTTHFLEPNRRKGRPSVRDVAILPVQRVTRYTLLFKDLLSHTPSTSTSHQVIKNAVESALRIARKSDRAQGNAVFLLSQP